MIFIRVVNNNKFLKKKTSYLLLTIYNSIFNITVYELKIVSPSKFNFYAYFFQSLHYIILIYIYYDPYKFNICKFIEV